MNSLPLISHRLFVAAVGHASRAQKRPTQPERPAAAADLGLAVVAEIAQQRARSARIGQYHPSQAAVLSAGLTEWRAT